MTRDFFEELDRLDPDRRNMAMTVLEGTAAGERALLSDGKLVWESKAQGFFSFHREAAEAIRGSGQYRIGGCPVFCEVLAKDKRMVVCGGGHVSVAVIRIARMLGFQVTALEDRPKFADDAVRAGAMEVICGPFSGELEKIEGDADTFFVIATRGHRYDLTCLEKIAEKPHAYIGMVASRRRVKIVRETLIGNGSDPEVISRVHSPVGLDIGARTPEEIAVAIMAEIIEVKNRTGLCEGYPEEIRKAVRETADSAPDVEYENCPSSEKKREDTCEPEGSAPGAEPEDCSSPGRAWEAAGGPEGSAWKASLVLATIVGRKGSVPRETGAKMLIFPDGRTVGTVGGGCMEAEILGCARQLIQKGVPGQRMCRVDMTGEEAEEEGMACGGVMDVFLETL